jgi:DNA-binding transcriptional ArsR family regulator
MGHHLTEEALELVARRFRILGEPMRLTILQELREGEKNVTELMETSGATQANVSRHLAVLLNAGMVYRRREGVNAYYGIQDETIFRLCSVACEALKKEAHIRSKALVGK